MNSQFSDCNNSATKTSKHISYMDMSMCKGRQTPAESDGADFFEKMGTSARTQGRKLVYGHDTHLLDTYVLNIRSINLGSAATAQ